MLKTLLGIVLKRNFTFSSIERNALLIVFVWTGIFAFSLWVNINQEKEKVHEIAVNEIKSNFDDIDTFRKWFASQGGVYVPVSEHIKPNPSIGHLSHRDVTTNTGAHLTLVNTPYLLKQLSVGNPQSFNAHMTSLAPLNPANIADAWERKALLLFNEGEKEYCEIVEYKNQPHMRLIRPARYQESCGTCHTDKQYKKGEVLGGLTVSVPMQHYFDQSQTAIQRLTITHSSIWFLGLAGIGLVYRNEKKHDLKRRSNEDYLRQTNVAFNKLKEGLMITDPDLNIIAFNDAFKKLTGLTENELIGHDPDSIRTNFFGENQHSQIVNALKNGKNWSGEIELVNKNELTVPIRLSTNGVYNDNNELTNHIFLYTDIRERIGFEEKLKHLAHHDYLTELPNRLLLNDRLNQAVIHAERLNTKTAVLFLDLDHFKNINDSLGHHMGDSVLIQITQRLKNSIRKGDTLARHGGDEFVIIMEDIQTHDDIVLMANKLIASMKPEFNLKGQPYYLGVSIGISVSPDHGKSVSELISKADIAMYEAKSSGRNSFKFYTPDLNINFRDRLKLENDLRQAIINDEFVFHYQPQISLTNNKIIGAECLIRWQHPELGLIYPGSFIDAAEELDLMVPMGEKIIDAACAQMAHWLKNDVDIGIMAINVSGKQIMNEKLTEHVTSALEKYNLPSNRIELEVTENYIMKQAEQSIQTLEELRDHSVHISIDDFGTGYSSLNYLKKLPINKIKIDREFIDGIPSDPHDITIIDAVIAIAKNLNLKVLAEGVENSRQLNFLKSAGCDEYQGYYYSKPLTAEGFESLLKSKYLVAS